MNLELYIRRTPRDEFNELAAVQRRIVRLSRCISGLDSVNNSRMRLAGVSIRRLYYHLR